MRGILAGMEFTRQFMPVMYFLLIPSRETVLMIGLTASRPRVVGSSEQSAASHPVISRMVWNVYAYETSPIALFACRPHRHYRG